MTDWSDMLVVATLSSFSIVTLCVSSPQLLNITCKSLIVLEKHVQCNATENLYSVTSEESLRSAQALKSVEFSDIQKSRHTNANTRQKHLNYFSL